MKRWLTAVLCTGICGTALAQPVGGASPPPDAPTVTAVPSTRQVMLGEPFFLFISVTHPQGMNVTIPASLPLGSVFDETERIGHKIRNPDGTYTHEFEIALMAFAVGDVRVPPIPVTYALHGNVLEVLSKSVSMRVISFVGEGPDELRTILPPVPVERPDWTVVYIAAGVVAAICLGVIVWLFVIVVRRHRHKVIVPAALGLRLPPREEALARLERIEASGALDARDGKAAFHEVSEVLRDYIGRLFQFSGLDLTTLEIRNELLARPFGDAVEGIVRQWLEQCDLVKFAGADTGPDEARRALYDARLYIDEIAAATSADSPDGVSVDA